MTPNEHAFLAMIAWAEGTDNGRQRTLDRGYDVMVGGNLIFLSYKDHPRVMVRINAKITSSAAGRYQILGWVFDHYKKLLNLPDFSPASQDAIALQLIREQKALTDVNTGSFDMAVKKVNNIWASMSGSPYGQHTYPVETLRKVYLEKGGKIGSA